MKKQTTLTDLRDADFVRCCGALINKMKRQGKSFTPREIVRLALAERPDGFYVSYESALHHVRRGCGPASTDSSQHVRRGLWHDLCTCVERRMNARPGRCISEAVSHVLGYQRPGRFYMSERLAMAIFARNFKVVSVVRPRRERSGRFPLDIFR